MEQDHLNIDVAKCELAAKKSAWLKEHELADEDNDNEDGIEEEDAEEGNDSAANEVSH